MYFFLHVCAHSSYSYTSSIQHEGGTFASYYVYIATVEHGSN